MGSDRRLFDIVSRIHDWAVEFAVVPPLRILGGRCEESLAAYFERYFIDGVVEDESGGLHGHYFKLPDWAMRVWSTGSLPPAYAVSVPILVKQAVEYLRARKPDLVVLGHPSYLCGMVGAVAARICKIPVLLDYPDAWTPLAVETAGLSPRGATARILRRLEGYIARHAGRIVSITLALAHYIEDEMHCSAPVSIVSNGADDVRFDSSRYPHARLQLGLPDDREIVLYSGRLETWSGAHELVETMAAVAHERPQTLFLFVGDGLSGEALREDVAAHGIEDNVRFLGFQPFANMPRVIAAADVAIVPFPKTPTTDVCSPIKLFEYLLMKKAVITTDLSGIREAVRDEVEFIPNLETGPLRDALLALLADPQRRRELGERGYATAKRSHTWNALAAEFSVQMRRAAGLPLPKRAVEHATA